MSGRHEVRAERLSPDELTARIVESPVAYIPVGALEFHGPHLPIGLDGFTAHGVCVAATQYSGGIVLPAVYQGIGGEHVAYPWSIMMDSGPGIADHLLTTARRLSEFGVERAVIVSGHFATEQGELIQGVAEQWRTRAPNGMKLAATTIDRCAASPIRPDHAGRFECVLLHAVEPDLVHVERLPDLHDYPAVDPGDDAFGSHRHDPAHPLWGVFGEDPRCADYGSAGMLLDTLARWLSSLAAPQAS